MSNAIGTSPYLWILSSREGASPRRRKLQDERGLALSVWVTIVMFALILIAGIAVDANGQVVDRQQAQAVAAQAARAGGQMIATLDGGTPQLDIGRAKVAAQAYLKEAGYSGSVTVSNSQVRVQIATKYRTIFLSIMGINSLPISVEATSDSIQSYNGEEP